MKSSIEISIDLTAQELLAPPTLASMVEFDDIGDIDPLLRTGSFVANSDSSPSVSPAEAADGEVDADDSIEIELTAEQIDALLRGRPID